MLKSVPMKLGSLVWRRLTSTLTVTGENPAFDWIEEWMNRQSFSQYARRVKLSRLWNVSEVQVATPGYGEHLFWFNRAPLLIAREQDQAVGDTGSSRPREKISITVLGGRRRLQSLIAEIQASIARSDKLHLFTCDDWGAWSEMLSRGKRSVESVFMNRAVRTELVDYIAWFLANKQWYAVRGIPYALGLLFHGEPGTGKSSLLMALASHFDKPLYILNPAALCGETQLRTAMARIPEGAFLAIEDVDVAISAMADGKGKISLSALLNGIDGAIAAEGRILVMTTNNPKALSPALIRPGRVDRTLEIGPLEPAAVMEMAEAFFPDDRPLLDLSMPKTGAQWQREFMDTKPRVAECATCELEATNC
jgi:chaperone BCS1